MSSRFLAALLAALVGGLLYVGLRVGMVLPVLLFAVPGQAAPIFLASHDLCVLDTASDLKFWSAIVGPVTPETGIVAPGAGNQCSLKFAPTAGVAAYVQATFSAPQDPLYAGFALYVPCSTGAPATRERIADLLSGTTVAGIVTAVASGAGFKLEAFYESEDLTTNVGECSASLSMNGTPCGGACTTIAQCADQTSAITTACTGGTCVNDCDVADPGEFDCNKNGSGATFATTPTLACDTWHGVLFAQDTAPTPDAFPGAVQMTLWAGLMGPPSAVFNYGGSTRPQGQCAGGTKANYACATATDCPGSTCTTTTVVAPDRIRFGSDRGPVAGWTYYLDSFHVDNATAHPNVQMQTLVPNADGGTVQWGGTTGTFADVDETGVPDGDTTYLETANSGAGTQDIGFSTFATPTPIPTPLAVGAEVAAKSQTAGGTVTLRVDLDDDAGTWTGTGFDVGTFSDDTAYHVMPPVLRATKSDASAWNLAGITALEASIVRASGGTATEAVAPNATLVDDTTVTETGCANGSEHLCIDDDPLGASPYTESLDGDNTSSLDMRFAFGTPAVTPTGTQTIRGAFRKSRDVTTTALVHLTLWENGVDMVDTVACNVTATPPAGDLCTLTWDMATACGGGACTAANMEVRIACPVQGLGVNRTTCDMGAVEWVAAATDVARVTKVVAPVLLGLPDPALPNVWTDLDGDGDKTFCLAADSTLNDGVFWARLTAGLVEFQNVCNCVRGGATVGDIAQQQTEIMECATTQRMTCTAEKGTTGATCDVVFAVGGVNDLHGILYSDPRHPTGTLLGKNQMGYCDDQNGVDQSNACYCERDQSHLSDLSEGGWFSRTKGAGWLVPCTSNRTAPCTTNADCCVTGTSTACDDTVGTCAGRCSVSEASCQVTSDCPATQTCSPKFCTAGLACHVDAPSLGLGAISAWCSTGCRNAPGCNTPGGVDGFCLSTSGQASLMADVNAIDAAVAAASPVPAWIWGAPFPVRELSGLACFWPEQPDIGSFRSKIRAKPRFVDLYGMFKRDCPEGLAKGATTGGLCGAAEHDTLCFCDGVHPSNFGHEIAADILLDCLTNTGEIRTHDGVCTGGVCSDGRVGDACTDDAFCDLWRCSSS